MLRSVDQWNYKDPWPIYSCKFSAPRIGHGTNIPFITALQEQNIQYWNKKVHPIAITLIKIWLNHADMFEDRTQRTSSKVQNCSSQIAGPLYLYLNDFMQMYKCFELCLAFSSPYYERNVIFPRQLAEQPKI
jgi:hypothetical protein